MSVDYTVVLHPTIQNLVIKQGSGNDPTLVDVDWRGFGATGPITINTLAYGDVEINLPISTFERFTPSLAFFTTGFASSLTGYTTFFLIVYTEFS